MIVPAVVIVEMGFSYFMSIIYYMPHIVRTEGWTYLLWNT